MVAAQVFYALCAASMAVAAPQLNLVGLRSTSTATSNVNEEQVVSSVVTALGPSISQAVAAAQAAAAAQYAAQQRAAAEQAARQRAAAEQAARPAAAAKAAAEPTARPVYNFEYKVADNQAQTYISQSE